MAGTFCSLINSTRKGQPQCSQYSTSQAVKLAHLWSWGPLRHISDPHSLCQQGTPFLRPEFFQSCTKFISYFFHHKELFTINMLMLLFLNVIIIKISCTIFNNRKPSSHLSSQALTCIMHTPEIYLWDFNLSIIVVCEQAQWVRAQRTAKWFCLECYNYY